MLGCKGLTNVTYFWLKTNEVDKAFDGYIFKTDLLIPSVIQKITFQMFQNLSI